jgi:dihydropyrimidinase
MGIVLRGATVVNADAACLADLRICDETIAAIGAELVQAGDQVIDVAGCYLFPGGIDPHTHFDLDVGSTVTADDFASGSRAAILGCTTTVIDYATQSRGGMLQAALATWQAKAAGRSFVDYGFHLALCDCNPQVLAELAALPDDEGVASVKLYLAYKDVMQVGDADLHKVMRICRDKGIRVCLHCENGDLIDALIAEAKAAGRFEPVQHAACRPEILEAEAVQRAIAIAELTGCPIYSVHVSSARALALIRQAQEKGLPVTAETCPQYLLLDESRYMTEDFTAAKYVMSPPLRGKHNQESLWLGLREGALSCVGSDHCSFNYLTQKEIGRNDFSRIPNGIPGVENRFGLLYSYGVAAGKISLPQFVACISTEPAKLFGLYPRKGIVAVGSDADIVVWDTVGRGRITAATQAQRVDYNAYEGFEQIGQARDVFLRGHHIVQAGKIATGPLGCYLPRKNRWQGEDAVCINSR